MLHSIVYVWAIPLKTCSTGFRIHSSEKRVVQFELDIWPSIFISTFPIAQNPLLQLSYNYRLIIFYRCPCSFLPSSGSSLDHRCLFPAKHRRRKSNATSLFVSTTTSKMDWCGLVGLNLFSCRIHIEINRSWLFSQLHHCGHVRIYVTAIQIFTLHRWFFVWYFLLSSECGRKKIRLQLLQLPLIFHTDGLEQIAIRASQDFV